MALMPIACGLEAMLHVLNLGYGVDRLFSCERYELWFAISFS